MRNLGLHLRARESTGRTSVQLQQAAVQAHLREVASRYLAVLTEPEPPVELACLLAHLHREFAYPCPDPEDDSDSDYSWTPSDATPDIDSETSDIEPETTDDSDSEASDYMFLEDDDPMGLVMLTCFVRRALLFAAELLEGSAHYRIDRQEAIAASDLLVPGAPPPDSKSPLTEMRILAYVNNTLRFLPRPQPVVPDEVFQAAWENPGSYESVLGIVEGTPPVVRQLVTSFTWMAIKCVRELS